FRVFPPAERVRASRILIVPTALAPALGPVLGGLLVTDLSWRWVFYVNVPLGIAGVVFGGLFLHEQRHDDPGDFDFAGFILAGLVRAALTLSPIASVPFTADLWWMRALMVVLGFAQAHGFVPAQAAAFATVTPAATGRAATMFNAGRQLGGAVGVAVLSTVIAAIGVVHRVGGQVVPDAHAYHVAFLVAAAIALAGAVCAWAVNDADAA